MTEASDTKSIFIGLIIGSTIIGLSILASLFFYEKILVDNSQNILNSAEDMSNAIRISSENNLKSAELLASLEYADLVKALNSISTSMIESSAATSEAIPKAATIFAAALPKGNINVPQGSQDGHVVFTHGNDIFRFDSKKGTLYYLKVNKFGVGSWEHLAGNNFEALY